MTTQRLLSERRSVPALLATLITTLALCGCTRYIAPKAQVTKALPTLAPRNYVLAPGLSFVTFSVALGGGKRLAGTFADFKASLDFNPRNIKQTRLDAIVQLDSVTADSNRIIADLSHQPWFDTSNYPAAVFKTIAVEKNNSEEFLLKGNLQFRGQSHPVTLQSRFIGAADNSLTGKRTLAFTATSAVSRSEYGMNYLPSLIADTVELELYAEFQLQYGLPIEIPVELALNRNSGETVAQ